MSDDKKKPTDMTTEELATELFGKDLKEKLDEVAHQPKKPARRKPQSP